jgi:hypothetical protein
MYLSSLEKRGVFEQVTFEGVTEEELKYLSDIIDIIESQKELFTYRVIGQYLAIVSYTWYMPSWINQVTKEKGSKTIFEPQIVSIEAVKDTKGKLWDVEIQNLPLEKHVGKYVKKIFLSPDMIYPHILVQSAIYQFPGTMKEALDQAEAL